MKLGKLAPRLDPRTLKLSNYLLKDKLPPYPPTKSLALGVKTWGMMLNDQLGDCTIAACGHLEEVWTANAGNREVVIADADVLRAYEAVGGYNPADPATDQGAVVLDVLNYWRKTGIGGHRIAAYTAINFADHAQVRQALCLFGGCYLGISLPLTAQAQTAAGHFWDLVGPARTGDSAPGSWGGHAVGIVAYDNMGPTICTWGVLLKMTWRFFSAYVDEAYAILSKEWFNAQGHAPNGLDLVSLLQDLQALGGG